MGVCLAGAACAEPFTVERHELGPPRLVAMGVWEGRARAALWSGQEVHAQAPVLAWALDGVPLGEGHDVVVPGPGELSLEATVAGRQVTGSVMVGDWVSMNIDKQSVVVGDDASIDGRAGWATTGAVEQAEAGEGLRVAVSGRPEDATLRWMLASSTWSVLELNVDTADVLAETVEFDDGAVSERTPADPGEAAAVVLSVDGTGNTGWHWFDAGIGSERPLLPIGDHLVAVGEDVALTNLLEESAPYVVAELAVEEGELWLVAAEGASNLSRALEQVSVLDCAPSPDQPLPMWAVLEGRCTAADLDGRAVVLER